MAKTLHRTFTITASQAALMALADQPLSAPFYLNFVSAIAPSPILPSRSQAKAYQVDVNYRAILKVQGVVYHRVCKTSNTAFLSHDGPLARFEAAFEIGLETVHLSCTYQAKVPLISFLIRTVLDRALLQVASAMDRYAAHREALPALESNTPS